MEVPVINEGSSFEGLGKLFEMKNALDEHLVSYPPS